MLRTLRRRFILSHLLPLLTALPLLGIALIYVLENQVLLPTASEELMRQSALVAEMAKEHPEVWQDSAQAKALVARLSPHLSARLMLLDPNGSLLASSDPADGEPVKNDRDRNALAGALAGRTQVQAVPSQSTEDDVVDIWRPVLSEDRRTLGVVRLTHGLPGIYMQLMRQRFLIAQVLAVSLLFGSVIGWALALNLVRPLQHVTSAISTLAGEQKQALDLRPDSEEIALLVKTFNAQVERLNEIERNRHVLLANLVHELARPTGAVQSGIEALLNDADQDVTLRRELLSGMKSQVKRLHRLLDDLVQLHDQLVGSQELIRQPVAIREWLATTCVPWRQVAIEKGLEWKLMLPAELPVMEIDPDRLGQALSNILNNACKFTPSGGRVLVSAGAELEQVWIRVSDTGCGIKPEKLTDIFIPFSGGKRSFRSTQGMGLGLSIAQNLVSAHGGKVEVESTAGLGSHFTILLPTSQRDHRAAPTETAA